MESLFTCVFCTRPFSRHDALKRHWTTCKLRQSQALDVPQVELKPKGRKTKACDRCSRHKRACDATSPCSSCVRHRQTCTYSRCTKNLGASTTGRQYTRPRCEKRAMPMILPNVPKDATITNQTTEDMNWDLGSEQAVLIWNRDDAAAPEWMEAVSRASDWTLTRRLTQQLRPSEQYLRPTFLDVANLKKFNFLRRIASELGIADTFECGTLQARRRTSQSHLQGRSIQNNPVASSASWQCSWDVLVPGSSSSWMPTTGLEYDPTMCNLTEGVGSSPYDGWWPYPRDLVAQANELVPIPLLASCLDEESARSLSRSQQIVALLHDTIIAKHRPDIIAMTWSDSLEKMCNEFFSHENLQRYLDLFWAFWRPNWPAIHQPSFDQSSASLNLLAAMAILGASLSPDERDRAMAHLWFNPVEQLVFDDEFFVQDVIPRWDDPASVSLRKSQLETLQAAYCVVLYQTWEGSKEGKRRIRRVRYSAIVSLARDVEFASGSLRTVDTSSISAFNWEEFILRESLIRVFHYIFALDAGYALFNRHPLRMVLTELVMELTSPEDCFQAQSAEECFVSLKAWRDGLAGHGLTTVSSILAAICAGHSSPELSKLFERMSVLNMFTIVSGLYAMSFKLETSLLYSEEVARIQAGLDKWREFWPSPVRDQELASMHIPVDHGEPAVGFMRYAPEYWLLSRLIVERIRNGGLTEKSTVANCETADMRQLHTLLQSFGV